MPFVPTVAEHTLRFSSLSLIAPHEETTSFVLILLTCIKSSSVILALFLYSELLCGQAGRTIAVPELVEEAFESRGSRDASRAVAAASSASRRTSYAESRHDTQRRASVSIAEVVDICEGLPVTTTSTKLWELKWLVVAAASWLVSDWRAAQRQRPASTIYIS